jgi:hypothetical protein
MLNAESLIRVAADLSKHEVDVVLSIVQISNPGLTRNSVRNVIEALVMASRKLSMSSDVVRREVEIEGEVGLVALPGTRVER